MHPSLQPVPRKPLSSARPGNARRTKLFRFLILPLIVLFLTAVMVVQAAGLAAVLPAGQNYQAHNRPGAACWQNAKPSGSPPPEPFLYLPYKGDFSSSTWTSQMDHQGPNYKKDGIMASLGDVNSYNRSSEDWAAGGTGVPAKNEGSYAQCIFPASVAPNQIPSARLPEPCKGFTNLNRDIRAYESIVYDEYIYYDGHDGNDFGIAKGTQVYAAGDGVIDFMDTYPNSLGMTIEIYHPQGYLTRYSHLDSFNSSLHVGMKVKAGDPIARSGRSAVVNGSFVRDYWGAHLHFSVFRWNENAKRWAVVDPFGWDPFAGPDPESRAAAQQYDPLVDCNGEVSYPLWVGDWPQTVDGESMAGFTPSEDRYMGGWLGEIPDDEAPTPAPTSTKPPKPSRTPPVQKPTTRPTRTAVNRPTREPTAVPTEVRPVPNRVRIGSYNPYFLTYDPNLWQAELANPDGASDGHNRLLHKDIPGCVIQDNLGHGMDDRWRRSKESRWVGPVHYVIESWIDKTDTQHRLVVYDAGSGVRVEVLTETDAEACLADAEGVLELTGGKFFDE